METVPHFMSEEERYEAGVIPHDLVIHLGETAVKDFAFEIDETE